MSPHLQDLDLAHPDQKTIQSFFNRIAGPYDFLNSFLSVGLDRYWRNRLVYESLARSERSILDLGVGTGKSLNAFLKRQQFDCAVGCDFSEQMLRTARDRVGKLSYLVACDFHEFPFGSETFDLIVGSFILRSVQNLSKFFSEVRRLLRPGGKAAFLELTRPTNLLFRRLVYEPYLKFYVPWAGKLFSKHPDAYQFLSQSVQSFLEPTDLKKEFEWSGFVRVSLKSLSFGIATVIQGIK